MAVSSNLTPSAKCYNEFMKWREVFKFLSGAQAAHLLVHFLLEFSDALPFSINLGIITINLSEEFNQIAVFYNVVILAVLLYFAYWHKTKNPGL
jgi:hypothetical protein